jgi:hypothetical protein
MASPNVIWQPNPGPQTQYLASTAFEVLFGGRRGGGKSEASLADALHYIHHPGFAGIAFRQTYPELEQLIARSFKFYGGDRRGSWNGTSRTWNFPGGSSIKFRHLKDANAYRQYLGHEYQWMLFEELTSFEEVVYQQLKGSCRSTIPGLLPSVRATTNPGGKGHAWVKSYFVDVCPPGEVYVDPTTGLTRQYIPCPMAPQLLQIDPEYVQRLMSLPDADRKAWLDGDWDAYTGAVFKLGSAVVWTWDQFKERTGHDAIPEHWVRFRVMDWGYAKPFAILWIAVDEQGRGYVYREWYGIAHKSNGTINPNVGVSMQPTVVAQRIKAIETAAKEKISYGWTGPDLDSAGTGDTSAGITRLEYFQREGIDFDSWNAGKDSRKAKKTALEERLNEAGGVGLVFLNGAPMTHPKGCGELTAGAKHCIRTIPALEYDPAGGGEDIDTDGEDHAYDAVSAWCLMRPWKSHKPKSELEEFMERRTRGTDGSWMSN